jgi:hypothetical protein
MSGTQIAKKQKHDDGNKNERLQNRPNDSTNRISDEGRGIMNHARLETFGKTHNLVWSRRSGD